ncbi:MAG: alpha/beta fold hydrolase [Edaphobacter sp.]
MRQGFLSFLLTVISRLLPIRDRLNGTKKRILRLFSFEQQRLVIASGGRQLSAVYVPAGDEAPAVLICHGIGELVEYWGGVQDLLKTMGVSSLVFNYSGYGDSSGYISAANCEEDAGSAYNELVTRGHRSIVLLGFSLGSAVSSAVASRLGVDGLVLCEGFSTLREAGTAIGFPQWMTRVVPDSWQTIRRVSELEIPVLVVHSDKDGLFPVTMARRVADACGTRGELIVINGLSHNAPLFTPTLAYWQPVAEWVKKRFSQAVPGGLSEVRAVSPR